MDPDLLASLKLSPVGEPPHDGSELAEEIRASVDRLPPDLRQVVEAVFWARQRPADVARQIGCSRPAVYDRLARALGHLRDDLARWYLP